MTIKGAICPKDEKPLEGDGYVLQVLRFTDRICFIRCPRCRAYHQYETKR